MKKIAGLGLTLFIAVTTNACGGDSQKTDAAESTPTASATSRSPTASPDDENKILYHDPLTDKDVTVKEFRKIMKKAPKNMNCKESLTASKELGHTYPNGEDLYLRLCTEITRK